MATQATNTRNTTNDPYAGGPTLGAFRIHGVTPFMDPGEEAATVLGEAYALLSVMAAGYDTCDDLARLTRDSSSLITLNDALKARSLDAVARLIHLSMHLSEVANHATRSQASA